MQRRLLQAEMDDLKREFKYREEERAEMAASAQEEKRRNGMMHEAIR
jgi:hypothetical protein